MNKVMAKEAVLHRVKPDLSELLPTHELRLTYGDASAALEAGRFIRDWRKKAGLTQVALAQRIEVTQARVSAIESGDGRDGPSYSILRRVAEACGVSLAPVLGALVLTVQHEDIPLRRREDAS
jgi:DNA-binding XRE family transcriptional regulator